MRLQDAQVLRHATARESPRQSAQKAALRLVGPDPRLAPSDHVIMCQWSCA